MADLLNFQISRLSSAQLTVPRWSVAGKIVDSSDQSQVIRDFTGANAVVFPTILGNLTAAQQDRFVEQVVTDLIMKRFGVDS